MNKYFKKAARLCSHISARFGLDLSKLERSKVIEFSLIALVIAALPIIASLSTSFLFNGRATFTTDVLSGMLVLAASSWLALPGFMPEYPWSEGKRKQYTLIAYCIGIIFISFALCLKLIDDLYSYVRNDPNFVDPAKRGVFVGWWNLSELIHQQFGTICVGLTGAVIVLALLKLVSWNRRLRKTVTMQLVWHHQAQFAGIYAALNQGYFERNGLRVKILAGGPEANPSVALGTGEADLAILHAATVIVAQSTGERIVCLMEIMESSGLVFFYPPAKRIGSLSDIKGRRIGYIQDFEEEYLLRAMLSVAQLRDSDVTLIPGNDSRALVKAFAAGEIDLCIGHISNEPSRLRAMKCKLEILDRALFGAPESGDVFATTTEFLSLHPNVVRAARDAIVSGWDFCIEHADEAIDITLDFMDLNEATPQERHLQEFGLKAMLESIYKTRFPRPIDANQWTSRINFLHKAGVIAKVIDADQCIGQL